MFNRIRPTLILLWLLFATPLVTHAHVKWFADFGFDDPPLSLGEAITPTFIGLTILTFVALGVAVLIDRRLDQMTWYQNVNAWFEARKHHSLLIMRIALGATLLLSWQADSLLVPDLTIETQPVLGWVQFILVGLLLFRATTPIAGIGTLVLYVIGIIQFGAFYMLDYAMFVGVGWFLAVSNVENIRIRATRLPALYFTVGFSLCWVALEKLIYPQWGLYVLEQNPQLALGFPLDFFLQGAAFVELALGYLLIICLLQRPIALVITAVFFLTTLVFGRTEVIGHTIIHAALLVFLLEGPGEVYKAPITFHERLPLRMAFASVNFVLLLALLIVPYAGISQVVFEEAQTTDTETTFAPLDDGSGLGLLLTGID